MVENMTRSQIIDERIEEFLVFSDSGDTFTILLYGKEIRRVTKKYEGLLKIIEIISLQNREDQRRKCTISRLK